MLFNSIEFAVFLPIVFALYWFVFNKLKAQNLFLLAAGYFFYGWWDWRFLILLFASSTIDYAVGYLLEKTEKQARRKQLLGTTIAVNLLILGIFKYFNFFAESFVVMLNLLHIKANVQIINVVLPVGISFYTFQSMAYVIDVYRKEIKACDSYLTFLTFVSFFPQLVAGPINRAKKLLPQFYVTRSFNYDIAIAGLRLILYGLFKKVVIADNLAKFADEVFSNPGMYTGWVSAAGVLCFSIQIYCDFSGYSDIALGTANLFGFELMENFRTPYFATSLREFWQRWHISLSTWFRDYLYIPLGGNRKGEARQYFNLFITFMVSGLWHGANFTFIIWGFIHGSYVVVEDFLKRRISFSLPPIIGWFVTLGVVCFAWIFFRAASVTDAVTISRSLLHGYDISSLSLALQKVYSSNVFVSVLLACLGFLLINDALIARLGFNSLLQKIPTPVRLSYYYILLLLIAFVGLNDNAPNFIYFKF
jgi:D-alanyl-lipoteichoic acid acyltransferase DltB (MBOAT superfamily)